MPTYDAEAQEKAYELMMIQSLPVREVLRRMKEEYPKIAMGTIMRWKKAQDWDARYEKYRQALADRSDVERVRQIKPILFTVEELRDRTYDQLVKYLDDVGAGKAVTEKNLARVLDAFVRLSEMEHKLTGGGSGMGEYTARQLVNILIMVIERDPVVGPVFKANKPRIIDAVHREMDSTRRIEGRK